MFLWAQALLTGVSVNETDRDSSKQSRQPAPLHGSREGSTALRDQ